MTPPKDKQPSDDLGVSTVQAKFDEAHEQGAFGSLTDPTPNDHYTVGGVLAGKPTPETDAEAHAAARAAVGPPLPPPLPEEQETA